MAEADGVNVAVGDFVKGVTALQMTADAAHQTLVALEVNEDLQIAVFIKLGLLQRKQTLDDDELVIGIVNGRMEIGKQAGKIDGRRMIDLGIGLARDRCDDRLKRFDEI